MENCIKLEFKRKIESDAYIYILKHFGLSNIKQQCDDQHILNKKSITLRIVVPIFIEELIDLSQQLAIKTFLVFLCLLVILQIINKQEWYDRGLSINEPQLYIKIEYQTYPRQDGFFIDDFTNTLSSIVNKDEAASTRYYLFKGKVITISTVESYTQSAHFYCSNPHCDYKFTSLHKIGIKETDVIIQANCKLCTSQLSEDINSRVISDKITIELIQINAFEQHHHHQQQQQKQHYQILKLIIRDELINRINIGSNIEIIAIPIIEYSSDNNKIDITFEANNILQSTTPIMPTSTHDLILNRNDLKTKEQHWHSILNLAFKYASDVVPCGTYIGLKFSILLSLISNKQLNVIAIGYDTIIIDNLFKYTKLLFSSTTTTNGNGSQRIFVQHDSTTSTSSQNGLYYTIRKSTTATNSQDVYYLDAGSIILANNGICLLGSILSYSKKELDVLKCVMENGKFQISPSIKPSNPMVVNDLNDEKSTFSINEYKLNCSLWTYYDLSYNNSNNKNLNGSSDAYNTSLLPNPLIDLFGLVNYTSSKDDCIDDIILNTKLQNINKTLKRFNQIDIDIKQLINTALCIDVKFPVECEQLLRRYFIVLRRLYPQKMSIHILPLLYNICESITKLNLHKDVNQADCILAIFIYHEYIECKNGLKQTKCHLQHIGNNQTEVNMLVERIMLFEENLKYLFDTYAPNFNTTSQSTPHGSTF